MKELLLTLLIGIAAGVIDVLPMIKMKLDKYSEISAFVHYLIAPFIIFNTELFGMAWWLKGGVINLALAIPVVILAAKDDDCHVRCFRDCDWCCGAFYVFVINAP